MTKELVYNEELKCRCTKKSIWYNMDDSFDKKNFKSGEFTFEVGEIYLYKIEIDYFGKGYRLINGEHGMDEGKFFDHFTTE